MTCRIAQWNPIAMAPLVVALALFGCGGGGGAAPTPSGPSVLADFYVSAGSGSDSNPGTWEDPFKTLTHALSVATAGERVHAVPGTYDVANGETFPLLMPQGVELIGDEPAKGAGTTATLIRGGATVPPAMGLTIEAAVVVDGNATLAGFVVINPNTYTTGLIDGVTVWHGDSVVRNCHLLDCEHAGLSYRKVQTGGMATGNRIARCGFGIRFDYGPDGGEVEGNVVTENDTGVMISYGNPDLGGGAGGSVGGNWFVQNTNFDVVVSKNRTIAAQSNLWDAVPQHVETGTWVPCDIHLEDGTAIIDTTGALVNGDTFTIPTYP